MSLLKSLVTTEDIIADSDTLGGYSVLESDVYDLTIEVAFVTYSANKAMALNVHFKTVDGKQLRQQFWMTSGEAKGCKNYYENKQGDKQYLPGFTMANSLCLLTVGEEISKMNTEPKVINLYDYSVKKEIPTKVDMLIELLGKSVTAGVLKQIVNKNELDANTGTYVASSETRTENEINKLFRQQDGLTITEIKAAATEPVFKQKWVEKWKGVTKDKSSAVVANAKPVNNVKTKAPAQNLFA